MGQFTQEAAEHFVYGAECAASGRIDEAELAFAKAVVLAPDWHIARYQLGLLQFSSGRAAVALVTWAPLFDLALSNCLAHFVRGFASLAQDDFAQATAHFRTGLALPIDNAALAGDVEKVLARIEHLQGGARPVTVTSDDAASSHVLLSNYGRIGNLH
ncbi:MAG TPA: hypothetical protein VMZ74_05390 [Ramlibacter sp.]|nr:hypothetical protein [Ramlibacter sp.]